MNMWYYPVEQTKDLKKTRDTLYFQKLKFIAMIKKILAIILILLFPMIYSCDKIDDLKSFNVDALAGIPFYFEVNENDPLTINEGFSIFLDDPDIQDNLDKIDKYTIRKITYQVTYYGGMNDVILNGNFNLGSSVSIPVANVNLNTLFVSGTVNELNLSDQDLSNLANELKSIGFLTGTISGSVSDKPLYCEILLEMDVTAKVIP